MKPKIPLIEELQRYYGLWRESNAMYEDWAKAHKLSLNSILILYSFYEDNTAATQKLISQKWLIPKQTVNAVLKDFEGRGYIKMIPLVADKRNKQIHLTSKGQEFTDKIILELRDLELYVMKQMGLKQMECMNDNLALFIELFRQGVTKIDE